MAGNANFRERCAVFEGLKDRASPSSAWVSPVARKAPPWASIMVGGTEESYHRVEKVLTSIAAKYDSDPCVAWLGENGRGTSSRRSTTASNMPILQMIAEIYGILRDGLKMTAQEIGEVFGAWNKGRSTPT